MCRAGIDAVADVTAGLVRFARCSHGCEGVHAFAIGVEPLQ
jgi:hypothetical protein